jgi:hypothetical protein
VGGDRDKTRVCPPSRHQENPLNDVGSGGVDPIPSPSFLCVSRPPDSVSAAFIPTHDVRGSCLKATEGISVGNHQHHTSKTARPSQTSLALKRKPDDTRPAKRTRKAINCEPCRNSKLKCDRSVRIRRCGCFFSILLNRNRPCSSCVLRGQSNCRMWSLQPGLTSPRTNFSKICRDGRVVLPRSRWSTSPP